MNPETRFIYMFATIIIVLSAFVTFGIATFVPIEFSALALLPLFLHNLGFVFGTGGAVIVNAFNILLEKNENIKPFKMAIMSIPFKFVWIGLILMLIIHTGELITEQTILHVFKALIVYVILIGVSYLQFSVIPKVKTLMPKPGETPSDEFISAKNKTKIIPPILLVFWFLDFILSTAFEPTDAFGFLSK